jgi:uncharacterized protein
VLVAVLQLTAAVLLAQGTGVDSLFPARPVGYVNDFASVIDPGSRSAMEDLLARLRNATGAEVAVVTLPTIGDRSPNEVGVAIIRRWGIGARAEIGDSTRNAGLAVLLVPRRQGEPNSGKIYVAVGQGLEGVITDAEAGQVSDLMLPELSRGEYGPGLLTGVQALTGRIILANRGGRRRGVYWGGPWIGGGWGGGGWGGGGFGGGGFGGFGGGGGASGGGGGRSF